MNDKRLGSPSLIHQPLTGSMRLPRPTGPTPLSIGLALALLLFAARTVHTQVGASGPHAPLPQPIGQGASGGFDDRTGEPDQIDAARRFRAINEMRQKELVSDTNKLLKLANELDAEIHKTNADSLTPDQLHKLATIEKLARSVKEKMSTPVQGAPVYQPPQPPLMH